MSVRIKRIIGVVVFLLLVALVLGWIQGLVTPNYDWPNHMRRSLKNVRSIFNEPKDSIDAIYFGTSQTFCSISPMDIYDSRHIRSYNLATTNQRVPVAYYLLKAALRTQSPKYVVIDASGFYYTRKELKTPARWEEMVDSLPPTYFRERLDMMRENARLQDKGGDRKYILSSILPLLRYHSNYILQKRDYQPLYLNDLYERKGFVATSNFIPVDETDQKTAKAMLDVEDTFADDNDQMDRLKECIEINQPYLEKMQQLCREHGAELVFMKVPVCTTTVHRGYWSANKHDMTQELADRMGVKFLDMSYDDLGLDWNRDSHDGGEHVNYRGAQKITARLGEWLQEDLGLVSSEDAKLDAQWDYQSQLFFEEMDYMNLELEDDPVKFLERVQQGDYVLFTAAASGLGDLWTDEVQQAFESATGTRLDLRDKGNRVYLGVSSHGQVIEERNDKSECTLESELEGGLSCKMEGQAGKGGKNGSITINGTDYTTAGKGIHFVVYDNQLGCVVDSVCFNLSSQQAVATQNVEYQDNMREKMIDFVHQRMTRM